jgi:hypothetical protein
MNHAPQPGAADQAPARTKPVRAPDFATLAEAARQLRTVQDLAGWRHRFARHLPALSAADVFELGMLAATALHEAAAEGPRKGGRA